MEGSFPPSLPVENTIKLKVEYSHMREKEVVQRGRLMEREGCVISI